MWRAKNEKLVKCDRYDETVSQISNDQWSKQGTSQGAKKNPGMTGIQIGYLARIIFLVNPSSTLFVNLYK